MWGRDFDSKSIFSTAKEGIIRPKNYTENGEWSFPAI